MNPLHFWVAAVVCLALTAAPNASNADCLGCFDVVRVRAEFRDGTSRQAFFVHYPATSPVRPDSSDGAQVIHVDEYAVYPDQSGKLVLLDSIYHFEGITTATSHEDVDSVEVSSLARLVYLEDMKFGAWGTINVYTPRVLELLSKTPVARYEYEDTGIHLLLSYDPMVTEEDLRHLMELRDWERGKGEGLRSNMQILCNQITPAISDNSADFAFSDELNFLYERLLTLDTLVRTGPVGEYANTIRRRILARLDYLKAIRTLFQYNRYEVALTATTTINRVLGASGCDTSSTSDHINNGRWNSLACMLEQCNGLWLDNEHDYEVLLEKTDIVEVINESD